MKIVEQNQHRDVVIKEGEVEKSSFIPSTANSYSMARIFRSFSCLHSFHIHPIVLKILLVLSWKENVKRTNWIVYGI